MDLWWIVVVLLAGLALLARRLGRLGSRRQDDTPTGDRRARQEEVMRDLEEVLAPLLEEARTGGPVRVGPGTEFHERYIVVRQRIRTEFRSTTGIRFARELGYLLARPGPLRVPVASLPEPIVRALAELRMEMSD